LLACDDRVVEPVLDLAAVGAANDSPTRASQNATPQPANDIEPQSFGWLRTGLLAAAAALLVVGGILGFRALLPAVPAPSATRAEVDADIENDGALDAQELSRATEEARWALAYVASIGKRSALTLRDEIVGRNIVGPSARALQHALDPLRPNLNPQPTAPERRGENR
jgi:hypothetical protein